MSEPNAGSDLASLIDAGRARRRPFVVNGQKVWTSYSMVAAEVLLLRAHDAVDAAPKHKGITVLIIDMDTPGIEVRPLKHITGAEEFAEVFFTDVEVPAENLVGELDDGWRITMGSLAHERGGLWLQSVAMVQQTVDDLVRDGRRHGLDRDAGVRRRLAEAVRAVGVVARPRLQGLLVVRAGQLRARAQLHEAGDVRAPQGAVRARHGAARSVRRGASIPSGARRAAVGPGRSSSASPTRSAGGSSEIQRNIIATRVLGLPRK